MPEKRDWPETGRLRLELFADKGVVLNEQPDKGPDPSFVHKDVEDRLGVLPNFFRLTPETPKITENLWGFAKFGYLDNPLPSLFKERLFVYLSRFCEVRYCLARHVGFLVGLGHPAGDQHATPETIEQVVDLLRHPLPRGEGLAPYIEALQSRATPFETLPDPTTADEFAVIACATHVFLQTAQADGALAALRQALGESTLQHLLVFLAFVRTAHFWTRVHPELQQEDDIEQLLSIHSSLTECVLDDPEVNDPDLADTLESELIALRKEREQAVLLQVTLASIGDAVMTTDAEGRVTYLNDVAIELTGWTLDQAMGQPCDTVFNIVNEDTRAPVESPVTKVLREGGIVGLANHTILIARDGTERPIDDSGSPIRVGEELVGVVLVFRDVTERRRQEQALQDQERQFRTLANSIPQLAWIAEPDGHIFWYNTGWYDYTGTTLEQMQGWGWQSVHNPDVLPSVMQRWSDSIATGQPFEMVFPLKGRDGVFRRFLTRVQPVTDRDGRVIRWFGTNTDVDSLQRIEDELREMRSRLESTLAAAEIGTWEFDIQANSVRADRNLARMFGVTEEEAAGGPLEAYFRFVHPEDRSHVAQAIARAIETHGEFESQYRLVDPSGFVRWIIARGRVEADSSGRAVGLPCVAVDITSQRDAEIEVIRLAAESDRQRRLYDTVLSNTVDFNYAFDLTGHFTYINKALADLLQMSFSDVVGKNFFDLGYPPGLAERLQRQVQETIATRKPVRDTTPFTSYKGERQYEYIFVPVIGTGGDVEAVAGSTRDITELTQIQEELRETAARLSEADRRKDEFLATLAHELRNPLAPISSGLVALKSVRNDPKAFETVHATMQRQARQMVRLIDDLLDVSRITQGKLELRPCRVHLGEVIKSAVEAIQPLIDEAEQKFTLSLPAEEISLNADPSRLAQVVANLLNNASKYTPAGGQIRLSAKKQNDQVILTIQDSGIGIPKEMQAMIFEMFAQVQRPLEKTYSGLGIGLTLVKRLVTMHGGTVEVNSAGLGQGSEFRVSLPIPAADSLLEPDTVSVPDQQTSAMRILVVDDNTDAAHMLSVVVKILGNEVQIAHDGRQALACAEEFRPDVVFMDIGMPVMNGYEAAQAIRQRPWGRELTLVALSGWGQEDDRRKALEAGFDHHLVKPVAPDDLQQFLARLQQ